MARPTECTAAVTAVIADAVSRGATFRLACAAAGIHPGTLSEWRNRGETGEEPYASFAEALTRAEGEHAIKLLTVLDSLAVGATDERVAADAAKFVLSTRHSSEYGKTVQQVEHSGVVATVAVPMTELPSDATPEERRRLLREMVGRGGDG